MYMDRKWVIISKKHQWSYKRSSSIVSICLLAFVGHIIAGRILEKNGDLYSPGKINIGINVKYRRNIV